MNMKVFVDADRLLKTLKRLEINSSKTVPVLEDMGRDMVKTTLTKRFDAEKDPDRRPWKSLSPLYKMRKDRIAPGAKILVLTGKLRASIRHVISGDTVSIGTGVEYGSYHQYGNPSTNLPARPFLGFTQEDGKRLTEMVKTHIIK